MMMNWIKEHLVITSVVGLFAGLSIFAIGYYYLMNEEKKDETGEKVRPFKKAA